MDIIGGFKKWVLGIRVFDMATLRVIVADALRDLDQNGDGEASIGELIHAIRRIAKDSGFDRFAR